MSGAPQRLWLVQKLREELCFQKRAWLAVLGSLERCADARLEKGLLDQGKGWERAEEEPGKMFACFRKSLAHAREWTFASMMRMAGRPQGRDSERQSLVCFALKCFFSRSF